MTTAKFCELERDGLISFSGADAGSFLQGQLTSDVATLTPPKTQYSGYCTPKGRLLATFLLWRLNDEILLQVPANLREAIQSRISRYILRAKVKAADATPRYVLFGVAGPGADAAISELAGAPPALHDVTSTNALAVTRLPLDRYLLLVSAESAAATRRVLSAHAEPQEPAMWAALDIEAGVPVITPETQEQYVPQMVNMDLIGAVSYSKGCYPGQEIVARTHYLGRTKQRTYRVRLPAEVEAHVGDRLYSDEYGADQASGAILNVAAGASDALAVIYTNSVARGVHHGSLDGPAIEVLPLPYSLNG